MKAYLMKSPGSAKKVVRIVNGDYVVKDKEGNIMEKVGGPIGGVGILPEGVGILPECENENDFIPFSLEYVPIKVRDKNGVEREKLSPVAEKMVNSLAEMKAAYDKMYAGDSGEQVAPPPPVERKEEESPKRKRGRPKTAAAWDDSKEEQSAA